MKCPDCVSEDRESRVFALGASTTLLGGTSTFWDEDGFKHHHDPNTTTWSFKCSNGHIWHEKSKYSCPTCEKRKAEA